MGVLGRRGYAAGENLVEEYRRSLGSETLRESEFGLEELTGLGEHPLLAGGNT
jgi:hypothetical protein